MVHPGARFFPECDPPRSQPARQLSWCANTLTKPDHFRRYLGRRAQVRLRQPIEVPGGGPARRSVTGELVGADDRAVTVAEPGGVVAIPYTDIQRSNLVGE